MGRRPTTSAIAGTVRGSKQMNSTMRLRRGSRSRTQTMVGSSSISIAIDVMAASCREAVIASTMSGVLKIEAHASSVRGAFSPLPRVENSNMAMSGVMKKAPITTNTTTLKTCSLMRRELFTRSPQPSRCPALQEAVQGHNDRDDDDHGERQRLRESWLAAAHLAHQHVLDLERHDHAPLCDECGGRRISREGVRKQEQRAAQEGWCQKRPRHVAPVVPHVAAEAFGRLAPLRPHSVERR